MALIAGNLRLLSTDTPVVPCGPLRQAGDQVGLLVGGSDAVWQHVDGSPSVDQLAAFEGAWRQRGPAALSELGPSWALARFDSTDRVLWLARDAFGSRPLHWARQGERVAFASDLHDLTELPWVSTAPALDHLAEYLSFRYVHSPATLLRDVSSVPPGHAVRIDASGVRLQRWFAPGWCRPGSPVPDAQDAARQVDAALARAVARQLPSDEPVAVLLSGGLDSSALLYHARQVRPDVSACTVAVAGDPAAESPFAARVATVLGARHELVRISSADLAAAVDRATIAMGRPLPSPAAVVQLLFFEHVRAHRRVVLCGDGGDEVLGGRGIERIAHRMRASRAVGRVPRPARGLVRRAARKAGLRDLAVPPDHFGADRLIGGSRVFKSHERVSVLRDIGLIRPGIRKTVLDPIYREVDTDPLNQILHTWQRGWLSEDSLARAERMATAVGLEIRYPLLDPQVATLCNGWPAGAKLRRVGTRMISKAPLRAAMKGRLPGRVLNRPKRSLPALLGRWLRTDGKHFLVERIQRVCDDDTGTWNPAGVQALVRDHLASTANHGLKLWTLILYQAWRDSL